MVRYILSFILLYIAIKSILDVIDYFGDSDYPRNADAYRNAVLELTLRLQKVLEHIPKNADMERDYKPLVDLANALLLHSIPSKRELKKLGPVNLFYRNFGDLINKVKRYDGWSNTSLQAKDK